MVSDLYNVNVAMSCNEDDVVTNENTSGKTKRNLKGSISSPIPSEDVTSVLEYFGIATSAVAGMDSSTMHAHSRLSNMLKSSVINTEIDGDPQNVVYRIPERILTDNPKCGERGSSTASSFSAWRSSCRNPIYRTNRLEDMWPRIEHWWNILKWPLVLLLICSILGLFIYFLVVEMEINESLLNSDKVIQSNIYLREMNYQEGTTNDVSWLNQESKSTAKENASAPLNKTQELTHLYTNKVDNNPINTSTQSSTTGDSTQKQYGFTSGHQNNFGVPIEEDARILKRLNDELMRIHNGTTTPRMTTTTDEYRTKVSPTLPLINRGHDSTTERLNTSRLVNEKCISTSICRGIVHYDLTTEGQGVSPEEQVLFKYLLDSRCSARAAQFMCSLFEPECRPIGMSDALPPCKRFCKSVLEPCSQVVANSELLTELFDCDIYPESHDPKICNDPTRLGKCLKNEFKCLDSTCIPQTWRCDNIKDCANGDDEDNCKFCEQDEFKCTENDKCIPIDWRCDQYKDCPSGTDELDCFDDDSRSFPLAYGTPSRVYPFAQEVAPNEPNRLPYQTLNDEVRQMQQQQQYQVVPDQEHATSNVVVGGRHILVSKSLANFQDSTEIMMTSDSEHKMKYVEGVQTAHISPCPEGELRCLDGRCIALSQLCDKVADCSDGSDETLCDFSSSSTTPQPPLQPAEGTKFS